MSGPDAFPRYDISQTYDWNYDHAPEPLEVDVPPVVGQWKFCGLPVASPLGIPAGPLLNGRWLLYYASLGFDVLTYKTVRSGRRDCYPLPNLQPVRCAQLGGGERNLSAADTMQGSWAVSFGMPSKSPEVWRPDIECTKDKLPSGKVLVVSAVGTIQPEWTIDDLADDYARCARWAVEAGADGVETNFSCPNVSTCDGQLYQD
jgi:dihydroorotate dehydrogenase (NAD+) catalytic subunit